MWKSIARPSFVFVRPPRLHGEGPRYGSPQNASSVAIEIWGRMQRYSLIEDWTQINTFELEDHFLPFSLGKSFCQGAKSNPVLEDHILTFEN